MQEKEEMGVVVVQVIKECRRRSVQQWKNREEEWCIEWTWRREHKRKKNRKRKECAEDTDADRAT
jgi:hypothetical protein